MTTPEESPRPWAVCQGIKKSGGRCQAPAGVDNLCAHHSPRFTAEDRTGWAQRGARVTNYRTIAKGVTDAVARLPQAERDILLPVPDLSDTHHLEQYLARVVGELHAGELPPTIARAIGELLRIRIELATLNQNAALLDLEERLRDEGSLR